MPHFQRSVSPVLDGDADANSKASKEWTYSAVCERVVDGDTVVLTVSNTFALDVDFGFHMSEMVVAQKSARFTFRLARINAPEIGTPAGVKSAKELKRVLGLGALIARTGKQDKYGRWLVSLEVMSPNGEVINVNKHMLDKGFATPYT